MVRLAAVAADQRQPVHVGHLEVLKDHGGGDVERARDRFLRREAAVQLDVGLAREQALHGHADEALVIDEQDRDAAAGRVDSIDIGGDVRALLVHLVSAPTWKSVMSAVGTGVRRQELRPGNAW